MNQYRMFFVETCMHWLQACTKNLPNIENIICQTTTPNRNSTWIKGQLIWCGCILVLYNRFFNLSLPPTPLQQKERKKEKKNDDDNDDAARMDKKLREFKW